MIWQDVLKDLLEHKYLLVISSLVGGAASLFFQKVLSNIVMFIIHFPLRKSVCRAIQLRKEGVENILPNLNLETYEKWAEKVSNYLNKKFPLYAYEFTHVGITTDKYSSKLENIFISKLNALSHIISENKKKL